tara:strand:- start:3334 stop:3771 length:438 start_codon:yes stop_codon:yes gene_type:complete
MSYSFDPEVWGPHYWFFLKTLSISYPKKANSVTKKKYYDFIQNLPLFIPHEKIGNHFAELLDKYPVTPYLESRESFMKWVHFIHNIINKMLNKNVVSYEDAINQYYSLYKPKEILHKDQIQYQKTITYIVIISLLIILAIGLYKI